MYNRVNTKIFTKPFRRRRHRQDDTIIETVTTTTTASPTQPFLRWAQEAVVTASDALIPDILLLQLSQAAKQKIEQRVAQRLIVKDPTSVKGYLASAKVHRAQGNIRAALKVYEEGLQHVSPNNPQHTDLENKRRETRSALVYYNHRFQQLLPYELLVLIFQDLEFMDMLRCAQACQAWAEFVVAWLPFWEKVPTYIPSCPEVIHASPLIPLMCRHQIRVLHLEGPMHIDVLCELLTFLTDSDSCPSIQELCLSKLDLRNTPRNKPVNLLAQDLRTIGSRIKAVEFRDCLIPACKTLVPLLTCCSDLMRVSFSRITEYRCDIEDDTLKFYRLVTFPQISVHLKEYAFPRLTYLKLSKQGFHGSTTFWLAAILGRCPSLKHLFLDPEDSVRHGICFQHALDHCPLLETLVVAPYAEMPPTILDHQRQIDKDVEETFAESYANNDFKSSSSSNNERNDAERIEAEAATKKQISWDTKRLRRYVVSGHWISYSEGNENDFHDAGYGIMSIFSMNRATLELLYLYFDGYFVNTQALRCLGYAPSLRELRISTENSKPTYEGFRGATSCAQENLDTLFGYCPALEVIVIDINSCIKYFDDEHICRYYNYVTATDTMLKTIATRCPHIQHIKIACPVQYTSLGILNHFTGHDGKDQLAKLTFLEMYVPADVVVRLVEKTPSLKVLRARKKWSMPYYYRSRKQKQESVLYDKVFWENVRTILGNRGGFLEV